MKHPTMTDRSQRALDRVRVLVSGNAVTPRATPAKLRVKASADGQSADVYLYDAIGGWLGISAQQFSEQLAEITAPTINLHINSPGGDVFDGTAIYNAIQQHDSDVIVHVDGVAASIASIIALAGKEVRMGEGSYFMIHNPWSLAIGDAADLRETADLLDKVGGQLAAIYARQTGMKLADVQSAMDAETWYTAEEAVENGFADSVTVPPDDDAKAARDALALFDLSTYEHVPDQLAALAGQKRGRREAPNTIRDFEAFLRDAGGFSHAAAKKIATGGFKATTDPRDEDGERAAIESLLESLRQASNALTSQ